MQISHDFIATKTCPAHQIQCNIPTFEALLRKNMYLFLERSEGLITHGCLLCRSQIVYIRPYSLKTTTAFTLWLSTRTLQCLFVCGCACHNAFVLYLALTSLGISVPLCSSVVPSEQIVECVCKPEARPPTPVQNVLLKVSFCSPVSSEISDLYEISDLIVNQLFCFSEQRNKVWRLLFDVCCVF